VDDMAAIGVNVVVRSCNVAKMDDVTTLLESRLAGLPPIKGVIHGAMILRVSIPMIQTSCDAD
jgi:hypothetical protein